MTIRRSLHWTIALLALGLAAAGEAADREYVLRWLPASGAAPEGYRIQVSAEGGALTELDVGTLPVDPDGFGRYTLLLPAASGAFLTMTAYNAAGESEQSNEIFVPASLCDPALCDDGNPCTADDCGVSGCSHAAVPDGSSCNSVGGLCSQGQCGVAECLYDTDCRDAGFCYEAPRCENFSCIAAPPVDCGEPTQCAVPICDVVYGCQMIPLSDGTSCDDGNGATRRDECIGGVCQGQLKPGGGSGSSGGEGGKGKGRN